MLIDTYSSVKFKVLCLRDYNADKSEWMGPTAQEAVGRYGLA